MIGRTLFRYVLGEMLRTLAVALAWLMLVGFLAVLVRARFTNLGRLLGLADCLAMLPWILPYLFSITLPPAMLAASASTFGRLAAESELVAMRASGVSPRQSAAAPLVLGLVASLALVWLNLEGFRYSASALARRDLETALDVDRLCRPGSTLELDSGDSRLVFSFGRPGADAPRPVSVVSTKARGGGFQLSARDFDCQVRSVARGRGRPRRLVSFVLRNVQVVTAPSEPVDKGEFSTYWLPEMELPGAMSQGLLGSGTMRASLDQNLALAAALRAELSAGCGEFGQERAAARARVLAAGLRGGGSPEAVAELGRLEKLHDRLEDVINDLRAIRAEISRKLAFSFSPLIFALLGVGLGAAARKASKLVSLTLGVVAAAAYYGTWVSGRALSQSGLMPAELSPWVPNLLGLAGAWLLLRRQGRS